MQLRHTHQDVWDGGVQEARSDEPVRLRGSSAQQHVVLGEQIEDTSPLHRDQERRAVANEQRTRDRRTCETSSA